MVGEVYHLIRWNVENAYVIYKNNRTDYSVQSQLLHAFNDLPSNAPAYGPHPGWNTNVSDHLHLETEDLSQGETPLTPRSRAAVSAAADPTLGPWMDSSRTVALTAGGDIPTPSGKVSKLALLPKLDKDLIQAAGTTNRPSIVSSLTNQVTQILPFGLAA